MYGVLLATHTSLSQRWLWHFSTVQHSGFRFALYSLRSWEGCQCWRRCCFDYSLNLHFFCSDSQKLRKYYVYLFDLLFGANCWHLQQTKIGWRWWLPLEISKQTNHNCVAPTTNHHHAYLWTVAQCCFVIGRTCGCSADFKINVSDAFSFRSDAITLTCCQTTQHTSPEKLKKCRIQLLQTCIIF